jgi:hypothetical protein
MWGDTVKKIHNKKLFYLLLPIVLLLLIFLHFSSKKGYDLPVRYQFDPATNSISFAVLDGYELYDISCEYGFFDLSDTKTDIRNFTFDIGDIPTKKQEIVTIFCKEKNPEGDELHSVTYLILVQSESELIVETYQNKWPIASDSFLITRGSGTGL